MLGLDNSYQHLGLSDMLHIGENSVHHGQLQGGVGEGIPSMYAPRYGMHPSQANCGFPSLTQQQPHSNPPPLPPSHQHLPLMGDDKSYSVCSGDTTDLPPPPPITPPPPKERFSYTRYQLQVLSCIYERVKYPNSIQKQLIAKRVGITRDQVKIWFQNRRRKDVVGVKATKGKPAQVDEMPTGTSMVPDHILTGVVNELLRYAEDPRQAKKKAKAMANKPSARTDENHRPKPYDRPATSIKTANSNEGQRESDLICDSQKAGTIANDIHKNVSEMCNNTAFGMSPLGHRNDVFSASEAGSPNSSEKASNLSTIKSSSDDMTSPSPASHDMNHSFPHSPASSSPSTSSAESLQYEKRQNCLSLDNSYNSKKPRYSSTNSSPTQPTSYIPSSEQLDMVAPPNAVAPGAPPGLEDRHCESPDFDDDDSYVDCPVETPGGWQAKDKKEGGILTSRERDDPPPNVTAPKSDPLPDMSKITASSTAPTHSIFAPIPSYRRPQASWMDQQVAGHPAYANHQQSALPMADYGMFGHQPLPTGHYGAQNGHLIPHLPPPPAPSHLSPDYMYKYATHNPHVEQHHGFGMYPYGPYVADAPQLLSSMPPPSPYTTDPYASYKPTHHTPHMSPNVYMDPYQPLVISSLNNPYYNKDAASWQNNDRKPQV